MWRLISLALSFVFYLSAINRGDAAPVTSVVEATRYLARFGYLDQKYQNSSYSAVSSPESFRKAIEDFQSFAGLKKTGKLDPETKKWMNKPRCGVPDRVHPGSSSTRPKRFALQGSQWPKKQLTYKIKKYTPDMSPSDVDSEIARAFQMWADVTDLTFVHVNNQSADVDIDILFAFEEHGNCPAFKDSPSDVYAHAAYPINGGGAHFDEGKTWTLNSNKGTNLFQIATHEFGHSLGLEHTNVTKAVMFPYYKYSSDFKLDNDDIEGIQELYGENQLRKMAIELKASTREEWEKANSKLEAQMKVTERELTEMKMSVGNLLSELKESKQELAKVKMELEKKDADISKTVNDLSTKLNVNSQRFGNELKTAEDNLRKDLRAILNDLETTTTNVASARTELSSTKSSVSDLTTKLNARTNNIVDIGKMPTSCRDLELMGQKINGFFLIKGAKKMEVVYCDFYPNQNDKQKWIGYADVKSAPVHFYVQRKNHFNTIGTPIPFEVALVNEGNAMDLASGKFKAPRRGIYFFSFTAIAEFPEKSSYSNLKLVFYLNGSIIGDLWIEESTQFYRRSPGSLQFTLSMKPGDQVWVEIKELTDRVYLYGNKDTFTHFTGFMLEEEIVASL